MKNNINFVTLMQCVLVAAVFSQNRNFADHFASCHKSDPKFDNCIKNALNDIRPFLKTGLPQYGVSPFDPVFVSEVSQKRGGPNINYKLVLRNFTESGWTGSHVTRFQSDLDKNMIRYTQFFPEKRLNGDYEISGNLLGNKFSTQGTWNLKLFDFVQTITVTRKPRRANNGTMVYDTPLKVDLNAQTSKNLELHISNLLRGRSDLENMLDQIINNAWQLEFVIVRPLVNDLASTALTDIFTKNFQNFPFNEVIH